MEPPTAPDDDVLSQQLGDPVHYFPRNSGFVGEGVKAGSISPCRGWTVPQLFPNLPSFYVPILVFFSATPVSPSLPGPSASTLSAGITPPQTCSIQLPQIPAASSRSGFLSFQGANQTSKERSNRRVPIYESDYDQVTYVSYSKGGKALRNRGLALCTRPQGKVTCPKTARCSHTHVGDIDGDLLGTGLTDAVLVNLRCRWYDPSILLT